MEIDIVFTYVDQTDEEWRRQRDKHRPVSGENTARFDDSLQEIRYALRSIVAHMKFKYRRIYFVTNNGALPWFVKPRKNMVSILYSDLTGCEGYNSNTIEAHLHKIDGLSEYYLYFNDDMILTRDLYLHDLIHPHTGDLMWYAESDPLFSFVSRHPVISRLINFISALPIINRFLFISDTVPSSRQYTHDIIGKTPALVIGHCPRIFKKSMVQEFFDRYIIYIEAQKSHLFRRPDDFSFVDGFCHYFDGNGLNHSTRYKTTILVQMDHSLLSWFYNNTKTMEQFLCVEDTRRFPVVDVICRDILETLFPDRTEFELKQERY